MSPVRIDDVACAARVLLAAPEARRPALLRQMLAEAALGDAHRRRTGRAHPVFGDGSLMAAALAHVAVPVPGPGDRAYLACLSQVIEGLIAP